MEAKVVVNIKIKIMCAVLVIVAVFANIVAAQGPPLVLSKNKDAYTTGDHIIVYANITNINNYPVRMLLEGYLTNEKGTYPTAVIPFELQLAPKESKSILIYNISVDEGMSADKYTINTRLLLNGQQITTQKLEFNVIGTYQEMHVNIQTCKDSACTEKSKVFVQGDNIYLDYSSSVTSPSVAAVLTYPDGTSNQVSLPSSIKATQIGTYTLDVTASKSGYQAQSVKEQFGVIAGEVQISSASVCNSNGRCDSGENSQNCPQDCKNLGKPAGMNITPYLFPALALFILILIVIMIFLIKRNL